METAEPPASTSADDWIDHPPSSDVREDPPETANAIPFPGATTAASAEPTIASTATDTATRMCRSPTIPPRIRRNSKESFLTLDG